MDAADLRARLAALLRFAVPSDPPVASVVERRACDGYVEERVAFAGFEGDVPAYRLVPDGDGPFPGVVAVSPRGLERLHRGPRHPLRPAPIFRGGAALRRSGRG